MDAPDTTRFRLSVHYDGSDFHGWQVQPDRRTVQGALEGVLSRLANRKRTVVGSGRTDTGVHATGQVAAVDMPSHWGAEELHRSLNATLPDDLWVESVVAAAADFHPRYDALRRTYRYEVGLLPGAFSPFHHRWCWALDGEVDRGLLGSAARMIVGEHSFAAFAKAGQPERGVRCHVLFAAWRETDLGVRFTITADRYLHHMVRYLVGTMVDVGRGRRPLDEVARLLEADPEQTTSPPAPARGLFLQRVEYPGDRVADSPAGETRSPTRPRSTSHA